MGTASCPSVPINNGTNGTTTFNLEIYIRDSQTRNSTEDIVTITMAPPGTGFVTGGGYLTMRARLARFPVPQAPTQNSDSTSSATKARPWGRATVALPCLMESTFTK